MENESTVLAKYLAAGLSVLPAKKEKKCPAIGRWKDYQERLPSELEIKTWFANQSASYNGQVFYVFSSNAAPFESGKGYSWNRDDTLNPNLLEGVEIQPVRREDKPDLADEAADAAQLLMSPYTQDDIHIDTANSNGRDQKSRERAR